MPQAVTSKIPDSGMRQVHVNCPEFNCTVLADVECSSLLALKEWLCKVTGYWELIQTPVLVNGDITDRVIILRVDPNGWCLEVTGEQEADPLESVHYSSLAEGDSLEVRRFGVAFVGGRFRLSVIAASEKFNAALGDKVAQLSRDYTGFRRIRGDGNCYYRAVIYGLIEFIITTGRREVFNKVIGVFGEVEFKQQTFVDAHNIMLQKLRDAR
eukprot:gene32113-39663_t